MNANPFKRPVQDPVLLGVGLVDYSIAELQAIQEQVQARLTRLEQQFATAPVRPQPVVVDAVREQVLAVIAKHRHQGIRQSDLPAESWGYRRLDDEERVKLVQQLLDDGEVVRIDPVPTGKAGRQPAAVLVAKAYAGKAKAKIIMKTNACVNSLMSFDVVSKHQTGDFALPVKGLHSFPMIL